MAACYIGFSASLSLLGGLGVELCSLVSADALAGAGLSRRVHSPRRVDSGPCDDAHASRAPGEKMHANGQCANR